MCYVLILVFGLKKKSPVIPVALITIVHKTSYQMKALSGLTWDFIQMAVTVSVHIYTMMNAGFIAEQWMWDSFFQDNHIKVQIHKMKFALMIYVTVFLNDRCDTWMQIYQFCCSAWQRSMHACPSTHAHTYTHTPVCMQVTKNFLGDASSVSSTLSTFSQHIFVLSYSLNL